MSDIVTVLLGITNLEIRFSNSKLLHERRRFHIRACGRALRPMCTHAHTYKHILVPSLLRHVRLADGLSV